MRKLIFCLAALSILLSFGCDKEDPMPPAPQVMAFFDVSNDNPEAGEEVLFTNKSENATIFEWDFGDGNTSSERDPIHIFSETGRYTIQLAAGNNEQEDIAEKTIEVVLPVNIFPGEGAGNISLGEIWGSIKDMEQYDFTEYGPLIVGNDIFHPVEEETKGITFYLHGSNILKTDSDPVVLIALENPFQGITGKGIGIGSTLDEVRNAYGNEDEQNGNSYDYKSIGINFQINTGTSKVEGISIYSP